MNRKKRKVTFKSKVGNLSKANIPRLFCHLLSILPIELLNKKQKAMNWFWIIYQTPVSIKVSRVLQNKRIPLTAI
jgi:hypothetical protein